MTGERLKLFVAAAVGVHPAHLMRSFRQHYRATIGGYVRKLRVDYACHLLSTSNASPAQVAYAVGFADQSHLHRTFKDFMGMTPTEVKAQVDEIVEFSGINERGDFSSLPMRTYSSGMGARLRFAIAAAKKHDVLLIDEALATGDAKFRKRSEQRVRDLRAEAGTVFLVSHSEQSIRDTCERSIWLESGVIRADGPTADVLKEYETYMRK